MYIVQNQIKPMEVSGFHALSRQWHDAWLEANIGYMILYRIIVNGTYMHLILYNYDV